MNCTATDTLPRATQWAPARAYRDALAAHEAAQASGVSVDELEAMTDKVITARDAVLTTPAPHHGALLEKMRVIFEADSDHGYTAEWSRALIGETLADMERLLSPSADASETDDRDREAQRLYAAWRAARARWDLAQYDRPDPNEDLPDEVAAAHCTAEHSALRAYLLHPGADPFALARKLRVMETEGAANFDYIDEAIEVLAKDAGTIAGDLILRSAAPRWKTEIARAGA